MIIVFGIRKTVNLVEQTRKEAVEKLFGMKSFDEAFEAWRDQIESEIGSEPDFHDFLDLGDSLRDIFRSTGESGRTQSTLAGAGAAWEGLVCWYLNLCLIGTRTVVIKHNKDLIPGPVADGITVNYGSFTSNTESDLIAITFPDVDELETESEVEDRAERIDDICKNYFEKLEVGVIQCKTNWKDNAQIPMLWGMIYSSKGFEDENITLGQNGFTMKDFRSFFYCFVTVPSTLDNLGPNSVKVKRVHNLSGGNYWGKPSRDGVADSLKEIFNRNFSYGWAPESQRQVVGEELEDGEEIDYFGLEQHN